MLRFTIEGLIYVYDRHNDRIQVFRKDGSFVSEAFFERSTRLSGSVSDLVFSRDPQQLFIYMVDGVNNEMRIIERATNQVVARFGRPGRYELTIDGGESCTNPRLRSHGVVQQSLAICVAQTSSTALLKGKRIGNAR